MRQKRRLAYGSPNNPWLRMKLHCMALSIIASVLIAGCSNSDQASDQEAPAAVQATRKVQFLDGIMSVKIPADLPLAMEQGGIYVYGDSNSAVTLAGGKSPGGDAARLLDETVEKLKSMDADMEVVGKGDAKFGEYPAKTVEVEMKNNSVDVQMVIAVGVVGDQLASIQVVGPQSNADEVRSRAKMIFDSVLINEK